MHFAFGQIAEGKSCNALREKWLQKTVNQTRAAQLMPSRADETIPPAYPAPSPHG